MSRAQGVAAGLLHGARAMTDVTGFGLAGHLLNMADPSGVGADVQLDAVPVYDGALALAEKGVRSTLYPANRAALEGRVTGAEGPRADLLFDPQTAGGMLAALPEADAAGVLERLGEAGYRAARIGTVTDGPPGLVLR